MARLRAPHSLHIREYPREGVPDERAGDYVTAMGTAVKGLITNLVTCFLRMHLRRLAQHCSTPAGCCLMAFSRRATSRMPVIERQSGHDTDAPACRLFDPEQTSPNCIPRSPRLRLSRLNRERGRYGERRCEPCVSA
jgi:hypothetical protein